VRSLPRIVSQIPNDLRNFLDRVREYMSEGGEDRFVTLRELRAGGVVGTTPGGTITTPTEYAVEIPNMPTGLTTTGGLGCVFVEWDEPNYLGHLHTEVWGASTNVFANAVLLGTSPGVLYVDNLGEGGSRYYWIRFVNRNEVVGPFNADAGTVGTASSDPAYVLDILAGSITSTELSSSLNSRINLIDGSASTPGTIPNQLAVLQGQIDEIAQTPDYNNATTYITDDIVKYNGGIYQAKQTTTGNLPTNTTYWLKIGDYTSLGAAVAAHTAEIDTLTTDLGAETTARQTLATQMRGSYTGTDLSQVTSGLIYSERTARSSAISSEATARNDLAAQIRGTYTGTDITQVTAGLIHEESTVRANADSALSSSINTLTTTLNNQTASVQTLSQSVDGVKGLYTVKIDNNGNVGGFGLESVLDNVAIPVWTASTAYYIGAVRRIASVTTKVMRCITAGTSSTSTPTMAGAVGTTFTDGTVVWEIASSTATSTFISNVDKFAVTTPTSSLAALARSTAYSAGRFVGPPFVSVLVATTANITLSGTQTIDGVAVVAGNRVLVKDQTTQSQNGIYVVASGAWTRATDADTWAELYNLGVKPTSGTNAGNIYVTSIPASGTVGTTSVVFVINSKMLVCKIAGTGTTAATITLNIDSLAIGSLVTDGTVTWQVASTVPFSVLTSSQTINGVTLSPGVYIDGASIVNATITNAAIGTAAITSAKISDVSADKITAGTLQVGSYIQSQSYVAGTSGWKIDSTGTAEFSQAVIRGSIFGGGATGYTTGTGLFSGLDSSIYKWRVGNPTGARIQWDGSALYIYNASNQVTIASGDIDYSVITGTKPPSDATRNVVYRQATAPTSGMSVNDVWFNTSTFATYYYSGTAWVLAGDRTSSNTAAAITNQGAFATTSQITVSTASTYIADLALNTPQFAYNSVSLIEVINIPTTPLNVPPATAQASDVTTILSSMPVTGIDIATDRIVMINFRFTHFDASPGYFSVDVNVPFGTFATDLSFVQDASTRLVLQQSDNNYTFIGVIPTDLITQTNLGTLTVTLGNGNSVFWQSPSNPPYISSGKVIIFSRKR